MSASPEELVARTRANVPAILRELPVWLLHDASKTPIYADGSNRRGTLDSAEDRAKLVTFEEAAAALKRVDRANGIGIALGEVPGEELTIAGIDIDGCYSGEELDPRAVEILGACASYAERSPSGNGLHVLGIGNIGTLKLERTADRPGLELYSGGRYFTVTGARLNGAHLCDITEGAALARALFDQRSHAATIADRHDDAIVSALKSAGLYLRDAGDGKHLIRCPWSARHTPDDSGNRETSSSEAAYFGPGANVRGEVLTHGMFRCQHAHCADRKLRHLREYLGLDKQEAETQKVRRPMVRWDALEGHEPPEREWVIPYWIPHHHLTLLAGSGGIGKTLIAQHIASALALGHPYIEPLEPRRVLVWAGEDDEAELWRRQIGISSWMGQPFSALTERFFLHSYAGADITLYESIAGELGVTPMFAELREQVADYRAEVVILDNIARVYGGSENDRHAVTTFCALLQGACAPAAVILLGHPAKAQGSEYSGSTAWEGAVRARLYLSARPPDQGAEDDDAPIDESVRYLARRKANYSALDIRRLRLNGGVLIPDSVEPTKVMMPGSELAKDSVRRAVLKLGERGMHGTASTASPNYLPKLARQYHLLDGVPERAFVQAMRTMILAGELASREVGKNSNRTPRTGLVLP